MTIELLTSAESISVIAQLASRQHGFLTRGQLLQRGMVEHRIQSKVRAKRIHPVHQGVYSVAPWQLTQKGRWIAAVMAAGPDALLSLESAASLFGLMRARRQIHVAKVMANSRHIRPTPGHPGTGDQIIVHRMNSLRSDERTVVAGIPVTSFPRTTIDLAGRMDRDGLDEYLAEADRNNLLHLDELTLELDRWRGKKGIALLREVLRDWYPATDEEMSLFESLFVQAIVAAGAPRPQVNPMLDIHLIDCLWDEYMMMIELDGTTYHADPATQTRDARRDRKHTLMGYQVNRIKWPEFRDDPGEVVEQALALLRMRGWDGNPPAPKGNSPKLKVAEV